MNDRIKTLLKKLGVEDDLPVSSFETFGEKSEIVDAPDGGMTLRMIINTDAVDFDREIVLPSGGKWNLWEQAGMPVFLEHRLGIHEAVGKGRGNSLKLFSIGGVTGWQMQIGIRNTPEGRAVAGFVRDFGSIGSSVTARIVSARKPTKEELQKTGPDGKPPVRVVDEWVGIETSLVVVPANPTARGNAEKAINELDRMVSKGRMPLNIAHALGLPEVKRTDRKPRRIVVCKG